MHSRQTKRRSAHPRITALRVAAIAACLLLAQPLFAVSAKIELKNGDVISGLLWQIAARQILIEAPYGAYRIPLPFLKRITIEKTGKPVRVTKQGGESFRALPLGGDEKGFHLLRDDQEIIEPWEEIQRLEFELPPL